MSVIRRLESHPV